MIGQLLKQLVRDLGRYTWYRTTRIFNRKQARTTASAASSVMPQANSSAPAAPLEPAGLDPKYERLVEWPPYGESAPAQEILSDPLYQMWKSAPHGHKWTHYFAIYQAVFGPRRAEPLRVLEIGVLGGSSLRLWKRYFTHPETVIVGVDIRPECIHYDAPADGIRVRIGSQADPAFLKTVVEEFGPFDIIIDDGSHQSSHMIASFNHLYGEGLKDSGIYFVEDLHANYWLPWRDSSKSFLDLCKELVEHMHAHYARGSAAAFLANNPSEQPMVPIDVPLITTMINEIRFFDSIVAIYKTRREYIPYYLRTES
jgi:hypothetical protein